MRVPLLFTLAAIALGAALVSCGDTEEVAPVPTNTLAPSASPPVSSLPTPIPGYAWSSVAGVPQTGLPSYSLQIPETWDSTAGNPAYFSPPPTSAGIQRLVVALTTVSAGYEHPTLFSLPQMGTTCSGSVPRGQIPGSASDAPDADPTGSFSSDTNTWDLYLFTCEERLTSGQVAEGATPATFDVRAGEAKFGDVVVSVAAFEDQGSASMERSFEQALRSFRLQ